MLGDLVDAHADTPGSPVAALTVNHRSTRHINELSERLRRGDADGVLAVLDAGDDEVSLVELPDAADGPEAAERAAAELHEVCLGAARRVRGAARDGDVAGALAGLDAHRLLCAHREGPGASGPGTAASSCGSPRTTRRAASPRRTGPGTPGARCW